VDYSKKNPTRNCEEFQRNFGFEVEKQLADVRKRVVKFDTSERDSSTPKANRPYPAVPVLMSSGVKRSLATSPASDGRPDLEVEVLSIPHVLPTGSLNYWLWQCHASRQMILSQYFPDYLGYNDTMDPDNSHYFAQRVSSLSVAVQISLAHATRVCPAASSSSPYYRKKGLACTNWLSSVGVWKSPELCFGAFAT
jgi:hypothetical protein